MTERPLIPEWAPPPGLRDPYVRRMPVDRATWSRALRRQIPELRYIAIAHTLAGYSNRDGSNAHPGIARLTEDCCSSPATVKRCIAWLVTHGWLTVQQKGRRRLGEADTYRLTVPATFATTSGMWDVEEHGALWMERPADAPTPPKAPVSRLTGEPKKQAGSRLTRELKNDVLGLTGDVLGLTGDRSRAHSCELPPGPSHQVLENTRPSGSLGVTAAAATRSPTAGGRIDLSGLDPHADDLDAQIEARLEEHLGVPLERETVERIVAMVVRGKHPRSVINAALAAEREHDGRVVDASDRFRGTPPGEDPWATSDRAPY